jgi:hypothetical protein
MLESESVFENVTQLVNTRNDHVHIYVVLHEEIVLRNHFTALMSWDSKISQALKTVSSKQFPGSADFLREVFNLYPWTPRSVHDSLEKSPTFCP